MFASLQLYLLVAIAVVLLATEVFALVDALRRPAAAFVSAGKRTKVFWSVLLLVGAVIGFIGLPQPLGGGFLGLAGFFAIIPALIYLSDVRPAIRGYRGPRSNRGPSSGPRGGW